MPIVAPARRIVKAGPQRLARAGFRTDSRKNRPTEAAPDDTLSGRSGLQQMQTLETLIAGLGVAVTRGGRGVAVEVSEIVEDSREASAGCLFVARSGAKSDGSAFASEAVRRGAGAVLAERGRIGPGVLPESVALCESDAAEIARVAAIMAERAQGRPSTRLSLVGVTGTNGKTTTCYLIRHILNHAGVKCGLLGTVETDDGASVVESKLTTPSAPAISRTLAKMARNNCKAGVMEVSSHALTQSRTAGLTFAAGVFTNLTGDHLDYHGTMEAYADAKALLFESLGAGTLAIVNAEDPWHARMTRGCGARVLQCKIEDQGDVASSRGSSGARAAVQSLSIRGSELDLAGPWGPINVSLPLVGRHNIMNALQAACVAHHLGLTREQVRAGLESAAAPPGRLEPVAGSDITVLVDYAHTDDALEKALSSILAVRERGASLWCVFGCGGDRDRTKRPRMARVASTLADHVVITSDNPRTEDPEAIIGEIASGVPAHSGAHVHRDADRARAIEHAIQHARPGDIVLIAGKGHETYQILPDGRGGTLTRDFDDRVEARRALAGRTGAPLRSVSA